MSQNFYRGLRAPQGVVNFNAMTMKRRMPFYGSEPRNDDYYTSIDRDSMYIGENVPLFTPTKGSQAGVPGQVFSTFAFVPTKNRNGETLSAREVRSMVSFVGLSFTGVQSDRDFNGMILGAIAGGMATPNFYWKAISLGSRLAWNVPPLPGSEEYNDYKKGLEHSNGNMQKVMPGYFYPMNFTSSSEYSQMIKTLIQSSTLDYSFSKIHYSRMNSANSQPRLKAEEEVATLKVAYDLGVVARFLMFALQSKIITIDNSKVNDFEKTTQKDVIDFLTNNANNVFRKSLTDFFDLFGIKEYRKDGVDSKAKSYDNLFKFVSTGLSTNMASDYKPLLNEHSLFDFCFKSVDFDLQYHKMLFAEEHTSCVGVCIQEASPGDIMNVLIKP